MEYWVKLKDKLNGVVYEPQVYSGNVFNASIEGAMIVANVNNIPIGRLSVLEVYPDSQRDEEERYKKLVELSGNIEVLKKMIDLQEKLLLESKVMPISGLSMDDINVVDWSASFWELLNVLKKIGVNESLANTIALEIIEKHTVTEKHGQIKC